jgi:hypothetical protein
LGPALQMPFPREMRPARASGRRFEGMGDGESAIQGAGRWADSGDNSNAICKIEMLTPKGEHSFPCSTRVMFDGRISFDGIATVKTL